MILGCSGAGKSTLARAIGAQAALPVTHLDQLYWLPGWVEHHPDFDARVRAVADGPRWVMDGSYSSHAFAYRVERADIIVLLDFPRWRCLLRVLVRTLRWRGRERPDMAPGCPERFDWPFLLYIWNWRQVTRPKTLARLAEMGRVPEILRHPRAVSRFLAGFDRAHPSAEGALA